jgi:hypothetical protein
MRRRVSRPHQIELALPSRPSSDDFEECLKVAGVRTGRKGSFVFDLRPVTFAPIETLVSLLCLVNRLAEDGASVTLLWSQAHAPFAYAERMGFFDVLHEAVDVSPERPKRGSSTFHLHRDRNPLLLELTPLPLHRTDLGDDALRRLTARLEENLSRRANAEVANRIWTCASETVGNIYEHSESPVPGLLAVQRYSSAERGDRLQLVIADAGLGLATTIRTGNPSGAGTKSDVDIILAAFREGLSSKLERGRGCGLTQCAQLAARYGGNLRVRTGGVWAKLVTKSKKGWTVGIYDDEAAFVAGTQLVFDFYLDRVTEGANLIH